MDHSIAHPEVPICEDVPKLARGLAELLGEWLGAATDGLFYSVQLQVRSRSGHTCLGCRPWLRQSQPELTKPHDPVRNTVKQASLRSVQLLCVHAPS